MCTSAGNISSVQEFVIIPHENENAQKYGVWQRLRNQIICFSYFIHWKLGRKRVKKIADSETALSSSFRSQTQGLLVFIRYSFNATLLPLKSCLHETSEASAHPSSQPPTHHPSICSTPYLFNHPPFQLSSVILLLSPLFLLFLLHILGYVEEELAKGKSTR